MAQEPCLHHLVKRVVDELGAMTTDPVTGVTAAPVLRFHYQCVECPAHFTLTRIEES